jgi:hypothetical protein
MLKSVKTRAALGRIGKLLYQKYQSQMKADKTYATGKLSKSFKYKVEDFSLDMIADWKVKYVDEGSVPSKVAPYNQIRNWAKAKGIQPKRINGKRKTFNQMAFAIASHISKNGTIQRFASNGGGSDLIDKVLGRYKNYITKEISEAFQQDLKDALDKNIKTNGN